MHILYGALGRLAMEFCKLFVKGLQKALTEVEKYYTICTKAILIKEGWTYENLCT